MINKMKKTLVSLFSLFIIQFSYSQSIDWVTEIKGNSFEEILGTTVSGNGDIYITGKIDESTAAYFGNITVPYIYGRREHYFTAKCDSTGNFRWVRIGGGNSYNCGKSVALDENNNIYTTGYSYGNAEFDSFNLNVTSKSEKSTLLKYDTDGNLIWGVKFGGNGYWDEESGECLRYHNGYLYDFCRNWGSTIFVNNQPIEPFYGKTQMSYLVKFDTLGNIVMAKRIAGCSSSDLQIRDVIPVNDDLIVTGFFQGDLSIDTVNVGITYWHYQSFIAKFNSSAELLWFKKFSSSNSTSFILDLDLDSMQNIMATGVYVDTLIVDNSTLIKSESPYYNSFLCKMDMDGNMIWIKDIAGPGEIISIAMSQNGDKTYLSGYFIGPLQTGNLSLSSPSGYNLFILKFDSSGNVNYGKNYGKTDYIQVNAMGKSNSGSIFITGQYLNSTILGPYYLYADSLPGPWNRTDGFIFKFNPSGNPSSILSPEVSEDPILIYPNPVNGILNIRMGGENSSSEKKIRIYNTLGTVMYTAEMNTNEISINCTDQKPGIYCIRIIDGNKQYDKKFIIE
jgi:hypothetical protein